MTEDIRNLLGGYATGTLTPEERSLLYQAALEDPALFEALADEQALKDLLDDSRVRARLLDAVENPRFSFLGGLRDWFDRPKARLLAVAGSVLLGIIGVNAVRESMMQVASVPDSGKQAVSLSLPTPEAAPVQTAPKRSIPAPAPVLERASKRQTETATVSPQPAPPAPAPVKAAAADAVTQIASSGNGQLRYTVLKRNAEGEYGPVSPDSIFEQSDRVRLRIETSMQGMLLVTSASGQTLYAGTVSPETPVLVPADLTFETAQTRDVDVVFTPLPAGPVTMAFTSREGNAQTGVVGGVPSGVVSGVLPSAPTAPPKAVAESRLQNTQAVQPPQPVKIRISLRRK